MNREIKPASDEDILAADVLVLVDPEQSSWQQLAWSAPIGDGPMESTTLQVIEIAVDSRDESQVEAARERVSRIKGGK